MIASTVLVASIMAGNSLHLGPLLSRLSCANFNIARSSLAVHAPPKCVSLYTQGTVEVEGTMEVEEDVEGGGGDGDSGDGSAPICI